MAAQPPRHIPTDAFPYDPANKRPRSPPSAPAKFCSDDCRKRKSKPTSNLDTSIVRIFLAKLNDNRPIETGIMCSEVEKSLTLEAVSSEQLDPIMPPDLRERVKCVARRSAVLSETGPEVKGRGRLEGVEAITPRGGSISAEQLSTYKGDFGLRKKEG